MSDWPLEPGERILWQGRPRADLHFGGIEMVAVGAFAAVVLAAALGVAWLMAANGGSFWPAALVGLLLSGGIFVAWPLLDRRERASSQYALTNRRALIRKGGTNRGLESWPIPAPEKLRLRAGTPGTVVFGIRRAFVGGGKPTAGTDVGFSRIDDAEQVFALMQRLASGEEP